jgi:hypothetical protein
LPQWFPLGQLFGNIKKHRIHQATVTDGQEHLSLYQYGWNNPILKPDPDGNFPIFPVLPLLPEIGAGLVAAGEALTGLLAGSAIGATAMKAFEHGGGSAFSSTRGSYC